MDIEIPEKYKINYINVCSKLDWDEYFMLQAIIASYKSKDPHTKVGCVFVDKNNHQLTMGYNGTIAGIDETKIPWGNDQSVPLEYQKYGYVIHAEANALSHTNGKLEGSRLYTTLFPCNECAKLIATHRVNEVIFLSDVYKNKPEYRIAKKIFDLSNIKYRKFEFSQNTISDFISYLYSTLNQKIPNKFDNM